MIKNMEKFFHKIIENLKKVWYTPIEILEGIQKISKMSEGKTILLVVVGVGLAIFIPAYVNNKPVL